jgi:hypothetical protein
MDDRFTKYSKLYLLIAALFLSVPVFLALSIAFFYGFFKIFASRPLDIFYEMVVITLPPALFASVYYIFFMRTKNHPAKLIKAISKVLFVLAFCLCLVVLGLDMFEYFNLAPNSYQVTNFKSFSLPFLAGNIALMFIIAMVQAFTTNKEEDWLEKRKRKDLGL